MCRSTDFDGFYFNERARLKVKSFYVRLSGLDPHKPMPDSLTLLYLPRVTESTLEIDGSKIRPDFPAFITLYRVVTAKTDDGEAVYGSRERVRASEGVGFEVYLREEKVLKGHFRKAEGEKWVLECKCGLEREVDVAAAEVCVALDGHVTMSEKVAMVVKRKNHRRGFSQLEEIPEEREVDVQTDGECCCSCGGSEGGWENRESEETRGGDCEEMSEMEMEGVRWAVDVGIWVMCLGVGYLVSKASANTLLRRTRLL